MSWHISLPGRGYETAHENFSWGIPDGYNIAHDVLRKHDNPDRTGLYQMYPNGEAEEFTFRDLDVRSGQLASSLKQLSVGFGDRVAVVLSQKPANPLTHLACWKLGAISVPLSVLFGEDALRYRLDHSGARVAVIDSSVRETVADIREDCPDLEHVIEVDGETGGTDGVRSFAEFSRRDSRVRRLAETKVETPATILYTSGSTGKPKGVLHTHGVWLGQCPGFYMYNERSVSESVHWTPADWAWVGALGGLVFPAWHYGRPVVGYPMGGFDANEAFEVLEAFDVTNAFIPPTAIRMMMEVDDPSEQYDLELEVIGSGGESLTTEILDWASESLDECRVNEFYGQTEAPLIIADCQDWFPARTGSMGKPAPGHEVAIVDGESGEEVPTGEVGQIAVRRSENPAILQRYWNQPERTAETILGDWHLTGDLGREDEEGYIWFKARDDDLIITSGYRVGPGEVEDSILEHPKIEQVGVIGVPDETRGEIIKAFVQPVDGVGAASDLREEIRRQVRDNLAKHEYPREIEFVSQLPTTTTGKIQRSKLHDY